MNVKRLLAFTLSALVFFNQVLFAHTVEINFWNERKNAALNQMNLRPVLPHTQISDSKNKSGINAVLRNLPPHIGTVQSAESSIAADQPIVFHIQDIHMNLEAQQNIARIIEYLVKNGNANLIGLEGAMGELNLKPFQELPEDVRRETADRFLSHLEIAGPVYFALTHADLNPIFVGVDDAVLFKQNWAAVRGVRGTASPLRELLKDKEAKLELEKARDLNPKLREFDRQVQKYRNGHISLGNYLDALATQTPLQTSSRLFRRAHEFENDLSLPALQHQRDAFIRDLIPRLTSNEVAFLIDASDSFRQGHSSQLEFLETALRAARKASVTVPAPLSQYAAYLAVAEKIKPTILMKEVSATEREVYRRLSKTQIEEKLIEKSDRLQLARKLVSFSMTPEEWEAQKSFASENASDIGRFKNSFESFYDTARKRDRTIANNLLRALRKSGAARGILVTGGFHSKGIQDVLRNQGVQVVTLSPTFNVVDALSGSPSLVQLANKKGLLDDLFPNGNTFLDLPSMTPGLYERMAYHGLGLAATRNTESIPNFRALANRLLAPVSERVIGTCRLFGQLFMFVKSRFGFSLVRGRKNGAELITERLWQNRTQWWGPATRHIKATHGIDETHDDFVGHLEEYLINNEHMTGTEFLMLHPWTKWAQLSLLRLAIWIFKRDVLHVEFYNRLLGRFLGYATSKWIKKIVAAATIAASIFTPAPATSQSHNGLSPQMQAIIMQGLEDQVRVGKASKAQLDRTENKYVIPAINDSDPNPTEIPTKEEITQYMKDMGYEADSEWDQVQYPHGYPNISVYFDTPDLYLAKLREVTQYNELRVQMRARTHALNPDVVTFEIKVLLANSHRAKLRFNVKVEEAWRVVIGDFLPISALALPDDHVDYPSELLAYHTWFSIAQQLEAEGKGSLEPMGVTQYLRQAYEPKIMAPGAPVTLRMTWDEHIFTGILPFHVQNLLKNPSNKKWLPFKTLDLHTLLYNTYRRQGRVHLFEAKYDGPMPNDLISLHRRFRLGRFLQPVSKIADNYSQEGQRHENETGTFPAWLHKHGQPMHGGIARPDYEDMYPDSIIPEIDFAPTSRQFESFGIDREDTEIGPWASYVQSRFKNRGIYHVGIMIFLVGIAVLFFFAPAVLAQGTQGTNPTDLVNGINQLISSGGGFQKTAESVWEVIDKWEPLVEMSFLHFLMMLWGHRITRKAGELEPGFALCLMLDSIGVAAMMMILQSGYIFGLTVLGVIGVFRYRYGERSRKDFTFLMLTDVVAVGIGITKYVDAAVLDVFLLIAITVIHLSGIAYGDVPPLRLVLQYPPSPEADYAINTILRNKTIVKSDGGPQIDQGIATHIIDVALRIPTVMKRNEVVFLLNRSIPGVKLVHVRNQARMRPYLSILFPILLPLSMLAAPHQLLAAQPEFLLAQTDGLNFASPVLTVIFVGVLVAGILLGWVMKRRSMHDEREYRIYAKSHKDVPDAEVKYMMNSADAPLMNNAMNPNPGEGSALNGTIEQEIDAMIHTKDRIPFSIQMKALARASVIPLAVIFSIFRLAARSELFQTTTTQKYPGIIASKVAPVQYTSKVPGTITHVFLENGDESQPDYEPIYRVSKDQKLVEVSPIDEETYLDKLKEFRTSIAMEVNTEKAKLTSQEAQLSGEQIRLAQVRLTLFERTALDEAYKQMLGYTQGYLQRAESLLPSRAMAQETVERIAEEVARLKALITTVRELKGENEREINKIGRDLEHLKPIQSELFEETLRELDIKLRTGLRILQRELGPRILRAPIAGKISAMPVEGAPVDPKIPILTVSAQQCRVAWAYVDALRMKSEPPQPGDTIRVRQKYTKVPEIEVKISDVFTNVEELTAALRFLSLEMKDSPQAVRPRPYLDLLGTSRVYSILFVLPLNYPASPGTELEITYSSKRTHTPLEQFMTRQGLRDARSALEDEPLPVVIPDTGQSQQTLGTYKNLSAVEAESGRKIFGKEKFNEISGGVMVGENLYLVDDRHSIQILRANDFSYVDTIDISGLSPIQGEKFDCEGITRLPDGSLALVSESWKEVHLINPQERKPQRKTFFKLPDAWTQIEGITADPEGRIYVGYRNEKQAEISEIELIEKTKRARIKRRLQFGGAVKTIRDLAYLELGPGQKPVIAILDAPKHPENHRTIHFWDPDESATKNGLTLDVIDISRIKELGKTEALVALSNRRLFIGAETKGFSSDTKNYAITQMKAAPSESKKPNSLPENGMLSPLDRSLSALAIINSGVKPKPIFPYGPRKYFAPGLYALWLPVLHKFPRMAPALAAVFGVVEGTVPVLLFYGALNLGGSVHFISALLWVWFIVNVMVKAHYGFVAINKNGQLEKGTIFNDLPGLVISALVSATSLGFLVGDGSVVQTFVLAWSLHGLINFSIVYALQKTMIIEVRVTGKPGEAEFNRSLANLEDVKKRVIRNPELSHLRNNILVVYSNETEGFPDELKHAAKGLRLIKGTVLVDGMYNVLGDLELAQFEYQDERSSFSSALSELVDNPKRANVKFAILSANDALLLFPDGLAGCLSPNAFPALDRGLMKILAIYQRTLMNA